MYQLIYHQSYTNTGSRYNARSHPLPFMKASNVIAPAKTTKEAPDLEEAFEEEDDGEVIPEPKNEEDEDLDLSKDKFIKKPKAKKAPAKKAAPKKKASKVADDDDDDDDEEDSEEDVKPKKKSRAKPAAAKAKGKK